MEEPTPMTGNIPEPAAAPAPEGQGALAQTLIAAFIVLVAALLAHSNAAQAPLQGAGDDLFWETGAAHRILDAPGAFGMLPAAPLAVLQLAAEWQWGGGSVAALRVSGLMTHLLAALALFLLARRGRKSGAGEGVPMGAALLFALSPAAAHVLVDTSARPALLGGALCLWALVCWVGTRRGVFLALPLAALAYAGDHAVVPFAAAALALLLASRGATLRLAAYPLLPGLLFVAARTAAARSTGMDLAPALSLSLGLAGGAVWPYYGMALAGFAAAVLANRLPFGAPRRALAAVLAAAALACGGMSFYGLSAYHDAETRLMSLAEASENDPEPWKALARHYERRAGAEVDAAAPWRERAHAAWRRAAALSPDDLETQWRAVKAGLPETPPDPGAPEAIAAREPLAPRAVEAAALAAGLGADAAESGYAAQRHALDWLTFAARRAPDRAEVAGSLGMALLLAGNARSAAPLLARAARGLPGDSPQARTAEHAAQAAARLDAAGKSALEKLAAAPNDPSGHAARVEAALLSGRLIQSLQMAAGARRRFPEDPSMWRLLGVARALRGEADRFLSEAGEGAAPESWEALARPCAAMGGWDGAAVYLGRAAQAPGASPETRLAEIAFELRRPDVAEQWLGRALETAPQAWRAPLMLAELAGARGDAQGAARWTAEAQRRGAPEDALKKPDGAAPPAAPEEPFVPVKTMIR